MAEEKENPLIAIDLEQERIESDGTAYFMLDDNFYKFMLMCEKENNIIGFEWNGTRNFGVIIKKK